MSKERGFRAGDFVKSAYQASTLLCKREEAERLLKEGWMLKSLDNHFWLEHPGGKEVRRLHPRTGAALKRATKL
jgi:hypothetical protein